MSEDSRIGFAELAAMSRRELGHWLESLEAPVPDSTWNDLARLLRIERSPEVRAVIHRARERIAGASRDPGAGAATGDEPAHVDLEAARRLVRSLLIFVTWSLASFARAGDGFAQEVLLDLVTEPPGAAAYLDEKPLGRTPVNRGVAMSGIPRLLRFEKPGHRPRVEAIGRSEGIGSPLRRRVELVARTTTFTVESVPPAMVLVEQEPIGKTPLVMEVTGEREVELLCPGHFPAPVTLIAGAPGRRVVHLIPEGDGPHGSQADHATSDRVQALARRQLADGDLPRAVEALQGLHARQRRAPYHVGLLVHCLLRASFLEEAASLVEEAAGIEPHPAWIAALAEECLQAGAPAGQLHAALGKVPVSSDADFMVTTARVELARGEPGKALDVLDLVARRGDPAIERLRVRAAHDTRDIERLARAIVDAVQAGVDAVDLWPSIEHLARRTGDGGLFVRLAVTPVTPGVTTFLDQVLVAARALERQEFTLALEESQELPPGKVQALVQAEVQLGRKDPRAALFVLAPLWESASEGGVAACTLARIFGELGDPAARASLERRILPGDLMHRELLMHEARRRAEAGASREAMAVLARLRSAHPRAFGHKELREEGKALLDGMIDPLLDARDVTSITKWADEWSAITATQASSGKGPAASEIAALLGASELVRHLGEAVVAHDWTAATEAEAELLAAGVLPLEPFLARSSWPAPLATWARRELAPERVEPLRAALLEALFARAVQENDHREAARRAWQMTEAQPGELRPHLLWFASWVAVLSPYGLTLVMVLLVGSTWRGGRRDRRRHQLRVDLDECLARGEHRGLKDLWNGASPSELPVDPAFRTRVAGFLAEGGHLEMAEHLLESLPSAHRESWSGIRTRLRLLSARREHGTAVTFLKSVLASPGWELPSIEEMLEVQVEVLMAAGEGAVAAERVRETLQHPTRPRLRPALAERVMDLVIERGDVETFIQLLKIAPGRRGGSPERLRAWLDVLDQRASDSKESRMLRVVLDIHAGRSRDAVDAMRRITPASLPGPADLDWILETIRGTTHESWFSDVLCDLADAALDQPALDDGLLLTLARHLETHGRPWEAYRCLLRIPPDSFKFPSVVPRIRALARGCLARKAAPEAAEMLRHLASHDVPLDPEETFLTKLAAGELPPAGELPANRIERASYAALRERLVEELRIARLDHHLAGADWTDARLLLSHRPAPNSFLAEAAGELDDDPGLCRELAESSIRLDHASFPNLRQARGAAVHARVALASELCAREAFAPAHDLLRDWQTWRFDLPDPERTRLAALVENLRQRCLGPDTEATGESEKHLDPDRRDEQHILDQLAARFPIDRLLIRTPRSTLHLAHHPGHGEVILKLFAAAAARADLASDGHLVLHRACLDNPYLVKIHEVGEQSDTRYVVMPHIPGPDLSRLLRTRGRLDPAALRPILKGLLSALGALHEAGLVHGDLSASNVRLPGSASPVLLDPGSLRRIGERPLPGSWTLSYAAPEILRGQPAGERADLFSLAALAYRLATGHAPFAGTLVTEVIHDIERGAIPPGCRSPGIDRPLETWILRSLEFDPGRRHSSASEMLRELEAT